MGSFSTKLVIYLVGNCQLTAELYCTYVYSIVEKEGLITDSVVTIFKIYGEDIADNKLKTP